MLSAYAQRRGSRLSGKTREGFSEGKPVNNEAAVWQCGGKNEETTKAATAFLDCYRLLDLFDGADNGRIQCVERIALIDDQPQRQQ